VSRANYLEREGLIGRIARNNFIAKVESKNWIMQKFKEIRGQT